MHVISGISSSVSGRSQQPGADGERIFDRGCDPRADLLQLHDLRMGVLVHLKLLRAMDGRMAMGPVHQRTSIPMVQWDHVTLTVAISTTGTIDIERL